MELMNFTLNENLLMSNSNDVLLCEFKDFNSVLHCLFGTVVVDHTKVQACGVDVHSK